MSGTGVGASTGLTFLRFHALLESKPPETRAGVFAALPAAMQDACWDRLAEECNRAIAEELCDPLDRNPEPQVRRGIRVAATALQYPRADGEDALRDILPATYVEHLADVEVPPNGVIRCPLPGHEDRTPSFKVYSARGVWCHGCQRGGSIYDFAGALWDFPEPLRGRVFLEVRRRLLEAFAGPWGAAA